MLQELHIKDLAIIDELTLSFEAGFTVFTGETGAGKSIIIDAIDLVLGDRASADLIRSGCEEARVEALFDISGMERMEDILNDAGIGAADTLLIKRIIHRNGRNRIFINGSLSTLMTLSEIGRHLIDICGQSEHQSLTRAEEHIDILDAFGGLESLREEMSSSYRKLLRTRKEFEKVKSSTELSSQERELMEFQLKEIESIAPRQGEDEELEKELELLRNAESIRHALVEGESTLYSEEGSVMERLSGLTRRLEELSSLDEELGELARRLESAYYELEDVAATLRQKVDTIEADPERLKEVEDRLDAINTLKRKYGGTIEEVLKRRDGIKQTLSSTVDHELELERLRTELSRAEEEAYMVADSLGEARRKAAEELKVAIEKELEELGIRGATFHVEIRRDKSADDRYRLTEKGAEHVLFLISTNPGEEAKPLNRIASGGELSRIMLAIKSLISVGKVPTLIFDEIDTGIGSTMAQVVARRLKGVSKTHQVLCITHMPQIAAYADTHLLVTKVATPDGRTVTRVKRLEGEERVAHIARMLGGGTPTETTLKHARELLRQAG